MSCNDGVKYVIRTPMHLRNAIRIAAQAVAEETELTSENG